MNSICITAKAAHTADLSSVVLEKNDSKTVYGVFSCDKAVVDAFSDNINVAVTNNNGAAYAVSAGVFNDSNGHLIHGRDNKSWR